MATEIKRIRMFISGRVQGVFYRACTYDEAVRLGVKGWVKNLRDGRVEVLAEGDAEKLKALEAWCWQGPPYARVTGIDVREEPVTKGELSTFDVKHSYYR